MLRLLVDLVVELGVQAPHSARELLVGAARLLRLPADDERRPRLVDEDVVDLVDDREEEWPLRLQLALAHHVVAQEVEAELVVRAVGHVRPVHVTTLAGAQVVEPALAVLAGAVAGLVQVLDVVVLDDPHGHPQRVEHGPVPGRVAPREVVVHGHEVGALAREGVEVEGQDRGEGLALARLHLCDLALVQGQPAHELHRVGPLPDLAPGHLAHGRERLGREVVEGLALRQPLAELVRDAAQLLVGEPGELLGQILDRLDRLLEAIDLAVVRAAHHAADEAKLRHAIQSSARRPSRGTPRRSRGYSDFTSPTALPSGSVNSANVTESGISVTGTTTLPPRSTIASSVACGSGTSM